jgi:hypothetical protein
MPAHDALRESSRNRLRPITMTTLAAIFTLLPLALAIGPGSSIQQPLASSIIAGLLLQFPTVLLAMPVLLSFTMRPEGGHSPPRFRRPFPRCDHPALLDSSGLGPGRECDLFA